MDDNIIKASCLQREAKGCEHVKGGGPAGEEVTACATFTVFGQDIAEGGVHLPPPPPPP